VHPLLDAEDNNDPTERMNILSQLSSPGKPYQFTVHLERVVLCSSQKLGLITLQQVLAAKQKGDKAMDTQIQATFRDAGPDAAKATFALVNEAIGHVKGIETFLDSTLGAGKGVNFESLNKLLAEMKRAVEPHATTVAPAGNASGAGAASAEGAPAVSTTIQTRADVLKWLGLICDYYRDNEPSSPVPLILQRAQRLVDKDFMTIMTDLTPDALKQLHLITGTKPEK
jgi:type VI secretion system protein ImpA